ncbi:MAG: alpha/beta fold hydrolase [bacterium]|nr:alpha/beta fold hydrolase [bacterium]
MAENRNNGATEPRRNPDLARRTQALSLSTWAISRLRRPTPDTPRGQVITLRAHQRLLHAFERERAIPEADRSVLRITDDQPDAVLLIHGISTRPGDLYELADVLHDSGYTVFVVRLPDYGTPGNTISEVSWEAALEQVSQCFRLLARGGGRIHVVGMGFGATLAVHLARTERVSSLVLLAPAIVPRESGLQRLAVRLRLHRLGFVHRWLGWNAELMEGMDRARGRIGSLRVPIYAAQCDDDDRADPSSLRILQRKAGHKASRFQVYGTGGHGILAAHGSEGLFEDIVDFCDGR